jgi:sensor histidine kinase YesM
MAKYSKYISPVAFGLLVYTSIRLVNDSMSGEQFWQRRWQQNVIEVVFSIAMGFVADILIRKAIIGFSRRTQKLTMESILREFGRVCLSSLLIFNPVLYLIHYLIHDPVDWNDIIIGNMLVVLYVLLHYSILRGNTLIKSYIDQQMQMQKMKNDQLQTELKFLRAQYHPHFLFNALNTVYFQMDESVPAAKQTIERLSELLRYQLYDQQHLVPVQQELNYLQNYIHLQQTRVSKKLQLKTYIDPQLNGERVYPLLFLPLVENAFKYVGGSYQISIEAKRVGQSIIFRVENSVPAHTIANGGGIGLENLKRRLQLLYPDHHNLAISKTEDHFMAELKLTIHDH